MRDSLLNAAGGVRSLSKRLLLGRTERSLGWIRPGLAKEPVLRGKDGAEVGQESGSDLADALASRLGLEEDAQSRWQEPSSAAVLLAW